MINLNGTDYRLCLLDTGVVSEWVKDSNAFGRFLVWSLEADPVYVPCLQVFSVIELRRSPRVFDGFVELFDVVPWMMLKGYDELQAEELQAYPDPTGIDPTSLGFTPLGGEGNLTRNLPWMLQQPDLIAREHHWNQGRQEVLDGMLSLVDNYPPDGERYSRAEIRTFIELVVFTQVAERDLDFARAILDAGEALRVDAFPSFKAMAFTVFYKFYVDRGRRATLSDVFDVIMASATPHVDAVVTEAHQAEVLDKVSRQDDFLAGVEVMTARDFR